MKKTILGLIVLLTMFGLLAQDTGAAEKLYQTDSGNYYKAVITPMTLTIPDDSLIGPGSVKFDNEAHNPGYMIKQINVFNKKIEQGEYGVTYDVDQTCVETYFYKSCANVTLNGVEVFAGSNDHYEWLVFWVAQQTIINNTE